MLLVFLSMGVASNALFCPRLSVSTLPFQQAVPQHMQAAPVAACRHAEVGLQGINPSRTAAPTQLSMLKCQPKAPQCLDP